MSHANWKDVRAQADTFEGVVGYDWTAMSLTTTGEAQRVFGQLVSGNYFDVLGVRAALGRTFGPAEDEVPGRDPVVVLSHGFWTKHAGADPTIVGKTVGLNGITFTVLGVTPEDFTGLDVGVRPEVWVPMAMNRQVKTGLNWYEERRGLFVFTVGRLKPGVTKEQALAQLTTLAERLEADYPNDNKGRGFTVVPLAQASINPNARQGVVAATSLLMTVVGLVLLIACANVSNLLLGRALQRRREIAVRLAIGASRGRLIRQLLTESVALALPAAGLGILIAQWARGGLLALLPPFPVSVALKLDLDWRVLGFTLAVGVLSGVLFGLLPALQASKPDVVDALKDTDRTGGTAHHRFGVRDFLVVGQVALSLIALVGAGLFLRSLEATAKTDPGFEATNLLTVGFDLDLQGYNQAKGDAFLRQLEERIGALPGVASASYAVAGPLSFAMVRSVFLEGGNDNDRTLISVNTVGPRFFETMGIPVVKGRPLTDEDKAGGTKAVVVNETMAKKFWPNDDAIGKRFRFFGDDEPWAVDRGRRPGFQVRLPGRGSPALHLRGPDPALRGEPHSHRAHRDRPRSPAPHRGERAPGHGPRPAAAGARHRAEDHLRQPVGAPGGSVAPGPLRAPGPRARGGRDLQRDVLLGQPAPARDRHPHGAGGSPRRRPAHGHEPGHGRRRHRPRRRARAGLRPVPPRREPARGHQPLGRGVVRGGRPRPRSRRPRRQLLPHPPGRGHRSHRGPALSIAESTMLMHEPAVASADTPARKDLKTLLEDYERSLILEALETTRGNQRQAAFALGILPTTLHEKLKRLGLWSRQADHG